MFKSKPIALRVRTAWLNIAEPAESGKYEGVFAPETPEEAAKLEAVIQEGIEEGFSGKLPKGGFLPQKDADARREDGSFRYPEHLRDAPFVFNAKTKYQPKCYWTSRKVECSADEIVGGDDCIIEVTAFSYSNQAKGVGISLNSIWRVRKGDKAIVKGGASGRTFDGLDVSDLVFDDDEE